ncbi:hypothetical protein Pan216_54340 [Planctomycetes bacterium Pan216]|uniref:DUF1559 domain-containing protein n=1 Tax=Kolteria novifilia TaxID=2527975 RepID=A0A518BC34_9BACT|nr:hypothetical protein Pan216_54340 [Planctomycetes bacterium Pan216]
MFNYRVAVSYRDITDGLSKTIAASELIHGDGENSTYTHGDLVRGAARPGGFPHSFPTTAQIDAWGATASSRTGVTGTGSPRGDTGANWVRGELSQTIFNTLLTPNSPSPSCIICSSCSASDGYGMIAARSRHPGGVHVMMGDGSTRFVSDTIDGQTWQFLGSVSDGEIVQDY